MKELTVRSEKPANGAARAAMKAAGMEEGCHPHPIHVNDIRADETPRMDMQDAELNRVLGGGLVPGSLVLLGGEPGIGKSTLILQTLLNLKGQRVLYVSGEESARQLKLRADRLKKTKRDDASLESDLLVLCETSLEQIFLQIEETQPDLVVIDSIQTIQTESVESSPGSLAQIRECAASLLKYAKGGGVSILLIGHINKEGSLAGPKVLEHIVDTVLSLRVTNIICIVF
jgi:DNA repair protein RadA/Sms